MPKSFKKSLLFLCFIYFYNNNNYIYFAKRVNINNKLLYSIEVFKYNNLRVNM